VLLEDGAAAGAGSPETPKRAHLGLELSLSAECEVVDADFITITLAARPDHRRLISHLSEAV
jgi:hypothetical protein